jgi:hypothetical protein
MCSMVSCYRVVSAPHGERSAEREAKPLLTLKVLGTSLLSLPCVPVRPDGALACLRDSWFHPRHVAAMPAPDVTDTPKRLRSLGPGFYQSLFTIGVCSVLDIHCELALVDISLASHLDNPGRMVRQHGLLVALVTPDDD